METTMETQKCACGCCGPVEEDPQARLSEPQRDKLDSDRIQELEERLARLEQQAR